MPGRKPGGSKNEGRELVGINVGGRVERVAYSGLNSQGMNRMPGLDAAATVNVLCAQNEAEWVSTEGRIDGVSAGELYSLIKPRSAVCAASGQTQKNSIKIEEE